tara:strand:- start:1005 stop:1925 length:921 start_codon:yes stop_codon:yes gene_type:complete
MAVYTHDGPGDWRQFVLREDIKPLPVMEQRSQFLKESYEFESFKNQQAYLHSNSLNSLNNQYHQSGDVKNKVVSATYGGTFTSVSSNTTFIDVLFEKEVSIFTPSGSGAPFISIVNGQQGGGSLAAFSYAFASGENSKTLRFTHVHPETPNNNGGAAANVIAVDTSLVGAVTSDALTGMTGAAFAANVTFTAAQGSGGTGFQDIVADVTTNPSGNGLAEIIFKTTAAAATYSPGQTLTATAADIGQGGTGTIVVTINSTILTGDILTLVGSVINENGSEIFSTKNNPGVQLDLSFVSNSTLTLVAS